MIETKTECMTEKRPPMLNDALFVLGNPFLLCNIVKVSYLCITHSAGVSYGPAPVKKPGSPLMNDDFMADITGAMWADWGRGDLQLIKDMGGNTIRMYGDSAEVLEGQNDPVVAE